MKKKSLFILAAVLVLSALTLACTVYASNAEVVPGDATGDGAVSVADLVLMRKYLANFDYDTGDSSIEISSEADINRDGKISISDICILRRYLASKESGKALIMDVDGVIRVFGRDGLQYTVAGYQSISENRFVFNTGLEITFDEGAFASEFNRLTFDYESTAPLKVFVTYTLDGAEKTDYFFLEATKTTFRGLIEGYLYGNEGVELKKLVVDTCENVEATFILHDLETETIPVYEDDLAVENDRYKIGVRLSWGGAMTYFEDKLDGDEELANLVNIHDTGRLIQQSFYGTYTNDEGYTSEYNGSGSLWPYNPVQGGDRFNQGSDRLIDVEYDEEKDYIYILSQSLDWAPNKSLTFTYYENTYSIMEGEDEGTDDDYVLVDNVATDFSGWKHIAGGQEIPAMYIVSYFDTFSFYNGTKPWTGDNEAVYYRSDLQGWENSTNIPMLRGNTETWSIWLNTADSFGFGIYCPNIQKHIAIRHRYDGSKDPMSNSCSYVAPSCSITMQAYKPIEYSYILATGSFDTIRALFTEHKDFTTNPSLSNDRTDTLVSGEKFDMMNMDFTVEANAEVFSDLRNLAVSYDSDEQAAKMSALGSKDPHATLNFDWNSDKIISDGSFNTVEVEYMLPESNSETSYSLLLFFDSGAQGGFDDARHVSGTIVRDGAYHTLSLRLPDGIISGDLHAIRFDPFATAAIGDAIYVKSIKLTDVYYPEVSAENDMIVAGSEKLFASLAGTKAYYDETQKAVALEVIKSGDVSVVIDFSSLALSTQDYSSLVIEYMVPATNANSSYSCTTYFATSEQGGFAEARAVYQILTVDGAYHTLTVPLADNVNWTGNIAKIRFDYFQSANVEGDVVYIKSINLQ